MSSPPISTADDHNAGRRAREVYRYFRPERLPSIHEDTKPTVGDLSVQNLSNHNARGRSPSISVQSPGLQAPADSAAPMGHMPESLILGDVNSTLISFAQLAALRLNVDRVFISVSDRDFQFIIAQAGQTPTGTDQYDLLSEGIYTGCSTLDISTWTMCKDTVSLPASNRERGDYSFVVSNDMLDDERYRDLALVQSDPSFRFYAGTPLTTDSNINVGCLFALDTKPRPEFSKAERDSMGHMAMLIMDFLKVSRQATEGRRAARLSRGMNYFVEGRSNFPTPNEINETSSRQTSISSRSRRKGRHHKTRSMSSRSSRSSSSGDYLTASDSDKHDAAKSSCSATTPESDSEIRRDDINVILGNTGTFRRAANLIRESLELGGDSGVVFVEAGSDPFLDKGSDSEFSSNLETEKTATVLALSTSDALYDSQNAQSAPYPVTAMNEDFLHRLLNTYQQGRIWSLHRDGQLSSSDSEDVSNKSRATARRNSVRSTGPKKWKAKENKMLNQYFPGATQVIFVPLWNAANSQWFGGFFCWNNVESDVFSQSVDLSSLRSFGSSIMVECSRVESMISDRQKADFLGSISHELRSPLHGILAAAEILQTTSMDQYQGSLMDTINACGRTLLDTMNQVLDYSKIISLEKRFRHLDRRRPTSLELKSMHRAAAHLDTFSATDLSILAEEVIDGVCLGHYHNQRFSSSSDALTTLEAKKGMGSDSQTHLKVDVNIDISPNDWVYHIPPGALRRIIMNIFSNALKYTDEGHVSLRLEVDNSGSRHTTQEDVVTLTVSDTGRGISEEFLRSRIFTPFVQEDSLASGSGLGLSIVRSLIKPLGGNINVQSQLGKGTTVKVILPLARPEPELDTNIEPPSSPAAEIRERPTSTNEARRLRLAHSGQTVAIVNTELTDLSQKPSWSLISHYLTDWFGLKVVPFSPQTAVDLILMDGPPSDDFINSDTAGNTPVLICSKEYIGQGTKTDPQSQPQNFDVINQPWGPHKLARFVQKCLNDRRTIEKPLVSQPTAQLEPTQPEPQPPTEDKSSATVSKDDKIDDSPEISSAQEPEQPSKPEPQPSEESSNPPEVRGPRVLVVEDNKINLNLMLAYLKKRELGGLDSAENGKLAIEAVQGENSGYDIIFMDISMPVMNGFEATRGIRAFERKREDGTTASTIIALTGLSSTVDEAEALDAGMDLFLTKPVAFKEVKKILDRWNEEHSPDSEKEETQP